MQLMQHSDGFQTQITGDSMNDCHHTLVAMYRNVPSSKSGLFRTFSFRKFVSASSTTPGTTQAQTQTT